jgi:RimJ/RimL family protein N-acetyltransferase
MVMKKMMLETERLIIRRFTDGDREDFERLIIDKMNSKYAIYDQQFPTDKESLRKVFDFFKQSDEFFSVELKENHRVIGFLSLNYIDNDSRNLGYCLHSDYHNQELGKEMATEIIKYAKEVLQIKKLVSGTAEENIPSVRLLQGLGFKIVKKELSSFANDEKGNPITFVGCLFECIL